MRNKSVVIALTLAGSISLTGSAGAYEMKGSTETLKTTSKEGGVTTCTFIPFACASTQGSGGGKELPDKE